MDYLQQDGKTLDPLLNFCIERIDLTTKHNWEFVQTKMKKIKNSVKKRVYLGRVPPKR